MSSARNRTLNHMKYLAALSAAGVAAACAGKVINDANHDGIPDEQQDGGEDAYGVVDPMPRPSCFNSNGLPTVSAQYTTDVGDAGADADAEGGVVDAGDGSRLVAVTFKFEKPTEVVIDSKATSTDATVLDSTISASGGRIVVSVPAGQDTARISMKVSCTAANDSGLFITLTLQTGQVVASVSAF
jgi:hypothetical protein